MNEDVPPDVFLDQQEDWLPDNLGEIEEEQGRDLEKQDGTCKEEAEMVCNRSTARSVSSGHEVVYGGACPRGLASDDSSAGKSGCQNRLSTSSSSSSSTKRNEEVRLLIQEMKRYLPAEREGCCGKTSTLCTLQYALKCVCQVQSSSQIAPALGAPGFGQSDAAWYRLEELAAITSERAPKNTDTFVAVFSLLCHPQLQEEALGGNPLVQLLAPQDVGVFFGLSCGLSTRESHGQASPVRTPPLLQPRPLSETLKHLSSVTKVCFCKHADFSVCP